MSADAPGLAPGTRVGEYEVLGVLGKGGMGTVYAGVHPLIGKKVAIKVLNPEMAQDKDVIARFVQEARSVNQIGHKNIIDIFAFGDLPGNAGHYFVMERLEGESLHARIDREKRLSTALTIEILEQVADAIDRAHAAGIFHRDLKPDNVFLVPDRSGPHVKVLDFGIAKLSEGASVARTRTGVPMGTPMFMSPEQWRGRDVDHLTDVYAMGVMAFVMLTGSHPFMADSFPSLMYLHLSEPPPPPSKHGVPAWTDGPILAALAKDKADRPASASAFVAALRRAMEHPTSTVDETMPAGLGAFVPTFPESVKTPAVLRPSVANARAESVTPSVVGLESKPGDYFAAPGITLAPVARRKRGPLVAAAIGAVAIGVIVMMVARGGGEQPVTPATQASGSSLPPGPKADQVIDAKLTAARAALTTEDWPRALALSNQALALAPEHPSAIELAARATDELGAHTQYERFKEQLSTQQIEAAARALRAIPGTSIYQPRAAQELELLADRWLAEQVASARAGAAMRRNCTLVDALRARVHNSFPDRTEVIATIEAEVRRCLDKPVERPKQVAPPPKPSTPPQPDPKTPPLTPPGAPPPAGDPDKVKF